MFLDEVIIVMAFLSIPTAVTSVIDKHFSATSSAWFRRLRKPMWIAPNNIFHTVWIFILVSMGLASYIVWKTPEKSFLPLLLYAVLLGLTWAWIPIFFRLKSLTAH
ncbi:translocator protein isoform X2 [Halyomorpha halys]|uniref:translocator protein isoform X2 n=1 Tax=Halyomorpha halys TaxID=286706 RepID=UPI0006D527D4|nr:translocator protein-like isoform X2 [Halyomorpha halys]